MNKARPKGDTPFSEAARACAGAFFDKKYDCAESIVRTFTDLYVVRGVDAETFHRMATGLGKGLGNTRGDCGALTGAALVIGAVMTERNAKQRHIYRKAGAFAKCFERGLGARICADLLKNSPLDCRGKTVEAAALLALFLDKEFGESGNAGG